MGSSSLLERIEALEAALETLSLDEFIPLPDAAKLLFGSSSAPNQQKVRRRVDNGLFSEGVEYKDLAPRDSGYRQMQFNIAACRHRMKVGHRE